MAHTEKAGKTKKAGATGGGPNVPTKARIALVREVFDSFHETSSTFADILADHDQFLALAERLGMPPLALAILEGSSLAGIAVDFNSILELEDWMKREGLSERDLVGKEA